MSNHTRRQFLTRLLINLSGMVAVASGVFTPLSAKSEWRKEDFAAQNLQQAIQQVFGEQTLIESKKIKLRIPQTAENGKVVPINISSTLKQIDTIALFVEKNPFPHIASFQLAEISVNDITARIKMAETCEVIVIVKTTENAYFVTKKMVKVTHGGCGG